MSYYTKKILGSLATGGSCGLVLWVVCVRIDQSYESVEAMLRFVIPSAIVTLVLSTFF